MSTATSRCIEILQNPAHPQYDSARTELGIALSGKGMTCQQFIDGYHWAPYLDAMFRESIEERLRLYFDKNDNIAYKGLWQPKIHEIHCSMPLPILSGASMPIPKN
jgi:hypothetical protein